MTVLHQPATMGDVLKYEVNPNFTRETVTLLTGTAYPVGSVLGRITASGKYKLATHGGTDGAQTATAVLLYAVDATLADAVGIVVVRGPSIVSRAGPGLRGNRQRRGQDHCQDRPACRRRHHRPRRRLTRRFCPLPHPVFGAPHDHRSQSF